MTPDPAQPAVSASRWPTRQLGWAIAAAVALVLLRSIVSIRYEQFDFDADQAIVGLMAKHLSEFRHFPLFFYGQNYMLGVQAWIAVPFFWLGGPTLLMLRTPLVLINIAVVVTMIVMFARSGLRPGLAFAATLPLIVTTPVASAALLETLGASVEPFAYVLALWALRRRPIAFGAVLCVGVLHREFTIFALPALLVATLAEGRRVDWRSVARGAVAFAVVWVVIDLLKLATGGGSAIQEAATISSWLSLSGYPARLGSALTAGVAELFGGRPFYASSYGVNTTLRTGSTLAGIALAAAAIVAAIRLAGILANRTRRREARAAAFPLYLAVIAIASFAAYGLNGGIDPLIAPVQRYFLFGLLLPVGLFAAFFMLDRAMVWRAAATSALVVWAALTCWDNVRLIREYRSTPPPSEFRALADALVAHHIEYGRARYWDSYIVDFLSRERVILGSTETVRIPEYQIVVDQHAAAAVRVDRTPCASGPVLLSWCIDDPLKRWATSTRER